VGRDRAVGIATYCGMEGPKIEFLWGDIFRTTPDRPWDPLRHLYMFETFDLEPPQDCIACLMGRAV
jgi:hypothetical protein